MFLAVSVSISYLMEEVKEFINATLFFKSLQTQR